MDKLTQLRKVSWKEYANTCIYSTTHLKGSGMLCIADAVSSHGDLASSAELLSRGDHQKFLSRNSELWGAFVSLIFPSSKSEFMDVREVMTFTRMRHCCDHPILFYSSYSTEICRIIRYFVKRLLCTFYDLEMSISPSWKISFFPPLKTT